MFHIIQYLSFCLGTSKICPFPFIWTKLPTHSRSDLLFIYIIQNLTLLSTKPDLLGSENFSSSLSLIIASAPFFLLKKISCLLLKSCPPYLLSSHPLFPLLFLFSAFLQSITWVFFHVTGHSFTMAASLFSIAREDALLLCPHQ